MKQIKIISINLLVVALCGCLYVTDDGLTLFEPYYMDRNRPVEATDLKILDRALVILDDESQWNRHDDRLCFHDEKWSLFCALAKASVEIDGKYKHRRVAVQETRFTINDNFAERWQEHQLMDFNNHESTKFEDIRWVLTETKKRLESRYAIR
ncbi:DUF6197 family protein [Kaarinaea lacus]